MDILVLCYLVAVRHYSCCCCYNSATGEIKHRDRERFVQTETFSFGCIMPNVFLCDFLLHNIFIGPSSCHVRTGQPILLHTFCVGRQFFTILSWTDIPTPQGFFAVLGKSCPSTFHNQCNAISHPTREWLNADTTMWTLDTGQAGFHSTEFQTHFCSLCTVSTVSIVLLGHIVFGPNRGFSNEIS